MKESPGKFFIKPICAAVLLACAAQAAQANPTGASVVNGQASFATNGNTLTVTNTPGAIINWQGFSIGANETTRFIQQSAASTVLNRVVSSNPSEILGSLQSNGRVFLVNPNGILFGAGATVDVAGLVATTLDISNADFIARRYRFTEVPGAGNISNAGKITVQGDGQHGGQIYLIAPNVENSGVITAPNGEILLAAGHSVELVDSANPNLRVNITAPAGDATNVGQLVASSGSLGLFGAVVRNSGTVSADSATLQGGKIVFKASQRTEISGKVSANGVTGGTIEALGNRVGIMDGATVSANGAQGGGTVLIGGDYQGKNPDVPNAQVTYVAPTATISADATDTGNGGKVIVWADDTTRAYGAISTRGGAHGGDGGFVETSGKRYLDVAGARVDTRAPNGAIGNWLLDPTDITILHSTSAVNAGLAVAGNTSTISDFDINTALATTNVTISTTSVGSSGTGFIQFDAAGGAITISNSSTAARTLQLNAENDIKFLGGATTFASPSSTSVLDVGFNPVGKIITAAGSSVTLDGNLGLTRAWVALAKTWENFGALSINSNAAFHIEHNYGAGASTLHNMSGGIVNVASTAGWAIWSNGCCQDGILINDGTINVTSSTAFEAAYSQSSSGTLNIADTKFLNLQNAIALSGGINLNATGALNINENHGTVATLSNLTFSGAGGTLLVASGINGTKTANLTAVSAPNVALTVGGGGTINILNGDTVFKTLSLSGGTFGAMTNGTFGIASGDFTIPTGVTYSGNIGYAASGNLTITTGFSTNGNIDLTAGGTLGIANAQVIAGSNMNVDVGGNMTLTAGTSQAVLKSGGTQTINFTGAGAHQMNLLGGTIAGGNVVGAFASVESGGIQQILKSGGGTLAIALNGGDVSALGLSSIDNGVTICATCATHNSATIKSLGTQTINATTLALTGGSGGNSNSAHIESAGASNITVTGAVTLTGGASGGTYVPGFGDFKGIVGNEADINSDTALTLNAGSISMAGGTATHGGAFIGAPTLNITTTGNLGMTGGAGSSGGALNPANPYPPGYIWYNAVAIGNDTANTVTLNIGGDLTLTGGAVGATGGSQAMIGGLHSTDVTVNGQGGITLNSANQFADRIGSWNGSGGSVTLKSGLGGTGFMNLGKGLVGTGATGSVTLVADGTGAAITQNVLGRIGAASLNASTVTPIGSINLPGSNKVASVVAATYGNFLYNGNMSFLANSIASTNGNVTLTSGAGDISLGSVSAFGGASVNAYGAIYETNGVGVADITANSVSLTSLYGGTAGWLAISADVSLVGAAAKTVSASVPATATYGGIRINNVGVNEPASVSLTDASLTPGYASVHYSTVNNVTSTSTYTLSSQNGEVSLYSAGAVTLTSLANFLPGQANAAYKFIDIWGNAGLTVSNPGSTAADMFLGTAGPMALSGLVNANNLGLYAAGPITASGATVSASYDVGMWSDSGVSLTNTSVAASSGSAYLGSAAMVFDTVGGKGYGSGGQITLSNSSVSAGYNVYGDTDGDIRFNNGSFIQAANDVYLSLNGAASTLYLNDTAGQASSSYILTNAPATTYVDFWARASGGVVIDGVETLGTAVGGSGFFSGNMSTPAALGAGLEVNYHVTPAVVSSLVSEIVQSFDTTFDTAGSTTATEEEKKKAEDAPVVADATVPVAESAAMAALPVCK